MSNSTLVPNGRVRNLPAYAVRMDGKTKCALSCKFCGRSSHVWCRSYDRTWGIQIDFQDYEQAMRDHVATCERASAKVNAIVKQGSSVYTGERSVFCYITVAVFNWIDRGDGGHKCNARCMSACGPSCECRCKGANHGGNAHQKHEGPGAFRAPGLIVIRISAA